MRRLNQTASDKPASRRRPAGIALAAAGPDRHAGATDGSSRCGTPGTKQTGSDRPPALSRAVALLLPAVPMTTGECSPPHPAIGPAAGPGAAEIAPEQPDPSTGAGGFPGLLSVEDLMCIFGRSESAMRRWIGTRLPAIRVGRSVFVHPDAVRRLLQADLAAKVLAGRRRQKPAGGAAAP